MANVSAPVIKSGSVDTRIYAPSKDRKSRLSQSFSAFCSIALHVKHSTKIRLLPHTLHLEDNVVEAMGLLLLLLG